MSRSSGSVNRDGNRAPLVLEGEGSALPGSRTPLARFWTTEEFQQLWQTANEAEKRRLGREVEQSRLYRQDHADPALVHVEGNQWVGPEALHPPFSVAAFEQGYAKSVAIGHGKNHASAGIINGEKYVIKPISPRQTMGEAAVGDTIGVQNPRRYEADAEMAGSQIAVELGLGDHVAPTCNFFYRGQYFVVSAFLEPTVPLSSVLEYHYDAQGQYRASNPEILPREQLPGLILYEYVTSDFDRNLSNLLINSRNLTIYEVDLADSFRYNDSLRLPSYLSEVYQYQDPDPWHATLDRSLVASFVSHEDGVLQILRDHHLEPGIPGVQARFAKLRDLLDLPGEILITDISLRASRSYE